MSHVEKTLIKCLDLVKTLNEKLGCEGQEYDSLTSGEVFQYDIESALKIVRHESIQVPLDVREAALMKQIAQLYLGEITL